MRETFYYFINRPNKKFFFFFALNYGAHVKMCTVAKHLKFLLLPPLLQRDFCVCEAKF